MRRLRDCVVSVLDIFCMQCPIKLETCCSWKLATDGIIPTDRDDEG